MSKNSLPAGACVPFVHAHKENEEIYIVTAGKGKAVIDKEEIAIEAGDAIRVSPSANRQFFASDDEGLEYFCIQVKAGSLDCYTMTDAIIK